MRRLPKKMKRREIVGLLAAGGVGALAGSLLVCTKPTPRASVPVALGPLSLFTLGVARVFPDLAIAALRTPEGLAFLRTRCTHLGCQLRVIGEEFVCPCHQGRFTLQGKIKSGPPPTDLAWVEGGVDAQGQVWCDPSRENQDRRPVHV